MKEERMVELMIYMNVPYVCSLIQKANKNIKEKRIILEIEQMLRKNNFKELLKDKCFYHVINKVWLKREKMPQNRHAWCRHKYACSK
jgi:hypothetical protein